MITNYYVFRKLVCLTVLSMMLSTIATAQQYLWEGTLSDNNPDSEKRGSIKVNAKKDIFFCSTFDSTSTLKSSSSSTVKLRSFGQEDIVVVKYGIDGVLHWFRSFGSKGKETYRSHTIDNEENVYVAFYSTDSGTVIVDSVNAIVLPSRGNVLLVKFDKAGVFQWIQILPFLREDYSFYTKAFLAVDSSNHIYYGQNYLGIAIESTIIYLQKYTSDGALLHSKKISCKTTGIDNPYLTLAGMEVTVSGEFVIGGIGKTNSINFSGITIDTHQDDLFLAVYDSSLNPLWAKVTQGKQCAAASVLLDQSNNIVRTSTSEVNGFREGHIDKYTLSGTLLWSERIYSPVASELSMVATTDQHNNIMIVNTVDSLYIDDEFIGHGVASGLYTSSVLKLDQDGLFQEVFEPFGPTWPHSILSMAVDASGHLILHGNSQYSNSFDDQYIRASLLPVEGNDTVFVISGYVADANGKPISHALVTDGFHFCASDTTGFYRLVGIKPGMYILRASKVGFSYDTVQTITIFDQNAAVDIVLKQLIEDRSPKWQWVLRDTSVLIHSQVVGAIAADSNNNLLISYPQLNVLEKIDSAGKKIWSISRSLLSSYSISVVNIFCNRIGSIYLTGVFRGPVHAGADSLYAESDLPFLMKISSDGIPLWIKEVANYRTVCLLPHRDQIVVVGRDSLFVYLNDGTLLSALRLFSQTGPGSPKVSFSTVVADSDNTIYLSGSIMSDSITLGSVLLRQLRPGVATIFLLKIQDRQFDFVATYSNRYNNFFGLSLLGINENQLLYLTVGGSHLNIDNIPGLPGLNLMVVDSQGKIITLKPLGNGSSSAEYFSTPVKVTSFFYNSDEFDIEGFHFHHDTIGTAFMEFNLNYDPEWIKWLPGQAAKSVRTPSGSYYVLGGIFGVVAELDGMTFDTIQTRGYGKSSLYFGKLGFKKAPSSVAGTSADHEKQDVLVYPQPAKTVANIIFRTSSPAAPTLKVFTVQGTPILSKQLDNLPSGLHGAEIDTKNLPSGAYIVSIEFPDNILHTKFQVQQ